MKRVKLKHGSARVEDDCPKETIEALNKLSEKAYRLDDLSFCNSPNYDFDRCPWIKQRDNCKSCIYYVE